jgi:hypothetical protein
MCFKLHEYSLQMWPTMALQILSPMFIQKFDQMTPKKIIWNFYANVWKKFHNFLNSHLGYNLVKYIYWTLLNINVSII